MNLAQQRLKADATNRSQRTFIQGFYIDIAVAAALFILLNIDGLDVTSGEAVLTFCVAFGKTLLTALASYVVRMWGDKSKLPTGPLPPEDPGPPAVEVVPSPPLTAVAANDVEGDRHLTPEEIDALSSEPAPVDPALLSHGADTVKAVSQRTKPAPVKKAPAKAVAPRRERVAKTVAERKAAPRKKQP